MWKQIENNQLGHANTYILWVSVEGKAVAHLTVDFSSKAIDGKPFVRVIALEDVSNTANGSCVVVLA